jgi:hypothetical protein
LASWGAGPCWSPRRRHAAVVTLPIGRKTMSGPRPSQGRVYLDPRRHVPGRSQTGESGFMATAQDRLNPQVPVQARVLQSRLRGVATRPVEAAHQAMVPVAGRCLTDMCQFLAHDKRAVGNLEHRNSLPAKQGLGQARLSGLVGKESRASESGGPARSTGLPTVTGFAGAVSLLAAGWGRWCSLARFFLLTSNKKCGGTPLMTRGRGQ